MPSDNLPHDGTEASDLKEADRIITTMLEWMGDYDNEICGWCACKLEDRTAHEGDCVGEAARAWLKRPRTPTMPSDNLPPTFVELCPAELTPYELAAFAELCLAELVSRDLPDDGRPGDIRDDCAAACAVATRAKVATAGRLLRKAGS